jgi:hypothetical protein
MLIALYPKMYKIFSKIILCTFFVVLAFGHIPSLSAQSLDIPVKGYGISFGNSKKFAGLRFNFRDKRVDRIDGLNVTLWKADENEEAIMRGISLGIIPEAGEMGYFQVGFGVVAEYQLSGVTLGILGAGAGQNVTGVNISLLAAGAGQNLYGITLAGLGAGAGQNVTGITFGGLGAGAGQTMTGINIGGLGVGAGQELSGFSVALLGAGAPEVTGVTVAGLAVGGEEITGLSIALAHIRVENDGVLTGVTAAAFPYIKRFLKGISFGIFNYAHEVSGIQIGLLNYVADNPSGLKILPIFNTSF